MASLVVSLYDLKTVVDALKAYHYPKAGESFDTESLRPLVQLQPSLSRAQQIPGRLCIWDPDPALVRELLDHMRTRRMTTAETVHLAATRIHDALGVAEEPSTS